jgi:hypothetical protein
MGEIWDLVKNKSFGAGQTLLGLVEIAGPLYAINSGSRPNDHLFNIMTVGLLALGNTNIAFGSVRIFTKNNELYTNLWTAESKVFMHAFEKSIDAFNYIGKSVQEITTYNPSKSLNMLND